jgi:hypothetical protein
MYLYYISSLIGIIRIMVINATFSNISAISFLSVLLVEETRVPEENHRHITRPLIGKKRYGYRWTGETVQIPEERLNLTYTKFEELVCPHL